MGVGEEGLVVIDGTNHRLGRLASRVAKMLLEGKRVVVLNADKIVITGSKSAILARYRYLLDRIFWYTVRRMLPRKKPKGREALSRLRVYNGVPEEFAEVKPMTVEDALHRSEMSRSGKLIKWMTLGELSKLIGGKVPAE
jgi:large subunit ribosomal protein L13